MARETVEFRGNDFIVSGPEGEVKPSGEAWIHLFDRYRISVLGNEEAVYGSLRPGLTLEDPEVRRVVDGWPGRWHRTRRRRDGEVEEFLVLARPLQDASPTRWLIHLLLFLATAFTVLTAGALLEGVDPLRAAPWSLGPVELPIPTTVVWSELLRGIPFGATLLGILLGHELGHYLAARFHGMRVSPPYFLPFPPYFSVVGTLGAFIRLRSPPVTRPTLLDVGIAGPAVSLVLSVPALVWGLLHSRVATGYADLLTPYVIRFAGAPLWIGDSVLVDLLARPLFGGVLGTEPILLHPVAFAGWIGLFVTTLNLLPFGQLDGGHILYASQGERQGTAARLFMAALLPLGFLWAGWWVWAALVLVLGRGRLAHPPTLLVPGGGGRVRAVLAWVAVVTLLLTFVPAPVRI